MIHKQFQLIAVASMLLSATAFADTRAERDQQRDVNQQQRIEQGLQSGQLTTHEAGKLEREQSHVDKVEAKAMSNGKISAGEQQHINNLENRTSSSIYNQKHDAQTGNPNSASSQRMQKDVQRNVNQQTRTQNGLQNGSLTNREASRLERGQTRVDRSEANAAANGHVGAGEQAKIQNKENRQSARIYRHKHN